ncbi:MAG: hypothetical protein AVDCRST_MAG16-1690 [uncultured Frankineae bacterium]|uniref:Uncharacterized protein n=1 Tax=uncultured Frankineae bacterium TaxID=437475 RepID=A0A6J4LQ09_9ACTN|nr:MAG: hypothetical protein AVDCRST_MAG16-1690 [uncultured Frankineae bacterium]
MRQLGLAAALAGVLSLEVAVALAYLALGTWWHYLLHQLVGWGAGLSTAALVGAVTRWRLPAVPALLAGQLVSIVPDLQFRYARMPHEPSMDVYLGHISLHTAPSPVLVALAALLLGGWGYLAVCARRPRPGAGLAVAGLVAVAGACLLARPLPTTLADHPLDTARVVVR